MRVAFESQLLLNENKTGIAWCADNVIRTLAKDIEYQCQLNYFSKGCSLKKIRDLKKYEAEGISLQECKWFCAIWYKLIWPFLHIPYHWFFERNCQITQFFNYVVPPGVKGKSITIIHDMAHLACPETVRLKTKCWLNMTLKSSCKRADAIITVSMFTKSELMRYFQIPENKIHVMYNGVDFSLYHTHYEKEVIEKVKKIYGISGTYILYLGTIEPRKNLQRLIQAYSILADKVNELSRESRLPTLVLAGGKGWLYDGIYQTAQKIGKKAEIIFTGYIPEEDAPILMTGAEIFCFPSIYEGFGMPPLEAMACGTPVLAANTTSLPEILGDCAEYVNPFSVEQIATGLENLIFNQKLRESYSKRGLEHVKKYSWENSVQILKQVYHTMIENGGVS